MEDLTKLSEKIGDIYDEIGNFAQEKARELRDVLYMFMNFMNISKELTSQFKKVIKILEENIIEAY